MARHRAALLWLRRTLRLADNPALASALEHAESVVPVFVLSPHRTWPLGPAGEAWLSRSLDSLDTSLRERGSGLVVRTGPARETLAALAAECGATAVYADRRYDQRGVGADAGLAAELTHGGVEVRFFDCTLINPPARPLTGSHTPFKVFSPYYRAAAALGAEAPGGPAPLRIPAPEVMPPGDAPGVIASLVMPMPTDQRAFWQPGEDGASAKLAHFLAENAADYETLRDLPAHHGTSRLSPHLAFGEISPLRVLAEAERTAQAEPEGRSGITAFVRQLYWRDYAYHLLHHFPETETRPMRREFERFAWATDPEGLAAWAEGRTGFPIVDAGMRELTATGWMHNRVRMIVASLLTKDLLIPWREGARHFAASLYDADAADNTLGWQWVAGSGVDAAPFFRIFNPVLQGATYDRWGGYVREWVPEIAGLPDAFLHRPWEAPADLLAETGIELGRTYPRPIVDHAEARARALAAYAAIRGGNARR